MRVIVSFHGGGLTINYEELTSIADNGEQLLLAGMPIKVVVNGIHVSDACNIRLNKKAIPFTDDVYLDTREGGV